jgi:hypothetical protein
MPITPSGEMTSTNNIPIGRIPLATRLSTEWRRMARQPHNIRRANSLGLPGEPVTHLQEMLLRSGLDDSSNAQHFDEYLAHLAALTRGGLPAAFDLVASSAWIVIRRFPVERRSQRVAANLLMDIEYQAFVREPRLKRNRSELHFTPDGLLGIEFERFRVGEVDIDPVGDSASLALLFSELEKKGLNENDIQMLLAVCHDINSVEIAPFLQIKPRSVRNRRERALSKAREVLLEIDHSEKPV